MEKENKKYSIPVAMVKSDFNNVLDIGCRKKILKGFLPEGISYQGVDFLDDKEIVGYDLEKGIPFEDNSFDIVFALDILEHVDNIEFLLKEILRVARKEAIIALPNMYYWLFRLRVVFLGRLSPHYDFYTREKGDRHKWLSSYYSSIDFVKKNTNGLKVQILPRAHEHKILVFLNIIDKALIKLFPNLFSDGVFFRIELDKKP